MRMMRIAKNCCMAIPSQKPVIREVNKNELITCFDKCSFQDISSLWRRINLTTLSLNRSIGYRLLLLPQDLAVQLKSSNTFV